MAELNGRPIDDSELMALALMDYGHFTAMRVEDRQVRGLSEHLARLTRDCRVLFGHELDEAELREYLRLAVAGNEGAFNLRVTVFDPKFDMGTPGKSGPPSVLVTTRPTAVWPPAPLTVQAVRYQRVLHAVKHIGLFEALLHRRAVQANGYDDALFHGDDFLVSEGATWNIGFFDGANVVWPDNDVLTGVTMKLLQQVHDDTVVASVDIRDIGSQMQAAFATNVTVGVRPITRINDLTLPADHDIFDVLRKEFVDIPPEPLV
jgi:branched-subunit amino acid aminotransferase/4-amino-4-deoxychorismate lyase